MELHKAQKIVALDNHDFRVVCCGRQWGKTTLAVLEMIACAHAKSGREIAYFATTFDQARNIAWNMLKEYARSAYARVPNESRLELYVRTQDKGESRITLRGFENIETARGQQFDLLVIDEVAFMRNWQYAWQQILEPTLSFRKGKALFISTPQGFNHFKEMYDEGQKGDEYWKSWRFKSDENPYLPKERIEQARNTSSPDAFATEYEADFRKYVGLVYKMFDRNIHVLSPFDIPQEWDKYRGIDFGSTNPTACVWIAVDNDGNWFLFDEYYESGKTIDYHAGVIQSKSQNLQISGTFGDPSGAQWIQEFAEKGIYITPATKETSTSQPNWVRYGIEKVFEKLKPMPRIVSMVHRGDDVRSLPAFFVFDKCVNTIRELETYRWKEKAVTQTKDMNEPDVPEKANDHIMDAIRYLAVSYRKMDKEEFIQRKPPNLDPYSDYI